MVQWLRLRAPNARGLGSVPGQGTKIPHASTKNPMQPKKLKINIFLNIQALMEFASHDDYMCMCVYSYVYSYV